MANELETTTVTTATTILVTVTITQGVGTSSPWSSTSSSASSPLTQQTSSSLTPSAKGAIACVVILFAVLLALAWHWRKRRLAHRNGGYDILKASLKDWLRNAGEAVSHHHRRKEIGGGTRLAGHAGICEEIPLHEAMEKTWVFEDSAWDEVKSYNFVQESGDFDRCAELGQRAARAARAP
jgi:hypothetical protein